MRMRKYYTVYNDREKTETIIAAGDANECSRTMGMTRDSFHSFVSHIRSGRIKGYVVVVEDLGEKGFDSEDDS